MTRTHKPLVFTFIEPTLTPEQRNAKWREVIFILLGRK